MADATPVQTALDAYVNAVAQESADAAATIAALQTALADSVPKTALAAAFTAWKADEDAHPARFNTIAFVTAETPEHYGPRAANTLLSYIGP